MSWFVTLIIYFNVHPFIIFTHPRSVCCTFFAIVLTQSSIWTVFEHLLGKCGGVTSSWTVNDREDFLKSCVCAISKYLQMQDRIFFQYSKPLFVPFLCLLMIKANHVTCKPWWIDIYIYLSVYISLYICIYYVMFRLHATNGHQHTAREFVQLHKKCTIVFSCKGLDLQHGIETWIWDDLLVNIIWFPAVPFILMVFREKRNYFV